MTTAAPLSIMPHGAGWKVASTSQPGLFYYVSLMGRRQTCTCGAFSYSRTHLPCKHIRAVKAMLAAAKQEVPMG
jgi:hypothetical protein